MTLSPGPIFAHVRPALLSALTGPQVVGCIPALTLAAFWLGGERALLIAALALPLLLMLAQTQMRAGQSNSRLSSRGSLAQALQRDLAAPSGMVTSAIAIALEDLTDLSDRHGSKAAQHALSMAEQRIRSALRGGDTVARLGDTVIAVALAPMRLGDLETVLQICCRLQDAIREPISLDGGTVHLSSSIGFCLQSRSPAPDGTTLLAAAEAAMKEAQNNGPGAIRAYSSEIKLVSPGRRDLTDDIAAALEAGQIRPWFQPQISTDTGAVSGFEALARWTHPRLGQIAPADFLPAMARAGLSERLSREMLFHAFNALRCWDRAGLAVPSISVNFSSEELRNPRLLDRITWELDRFDLSPDRLTVEILETVMSDAGDDIVIRNIAALADLGCGIDLDDFGTGHASIAAIRRFAVRRLKIDRSFITNVDRDRNQQDMAAAILTLAERLGLETVAEGVETAGEHAMMAQLGADHVQGFAVARPMPFEETLAWISQHHEKLTPSGLPGRRTG